MGFYNRSAYRFNEVPVPQSFLELEQYLAKFPAIQRFSEVELLAENICRRMADIDLYSTLISQALKDQDIFIGSIKIGSFLVAYLGACKSLLDAGAVSLTKIYSLPLSNKEQDFSKAKFWNALRSSKPQVFSRYSRFQQFSEQVIKWRDAAVHRITPLVIVVGPGDPDSTPRENMEIKMLNDSDKTISDLIQNAKVPQWADPLHLHHNWRSEFIHLCDELCEDLRDAILCIKTSA